jgi:hypothetical protein
MEEEESARKRGSLRFNAITRVADLNSRPSYPLDTISMYGTSEVYIHARHTSSESYLAISADGLDPWLVLRRWYDEHTVACCSCRECERETDTHSRHTETERQRNIETDSETKPQGAHQPKVETDQGQNAFCCVARVRVCMRVHRGVHRVYSPPEATMLRQCVTDCRNSSMTSSPKFGRQLASFHIWIGFTADIRASMRVSCVNFCGPTSVATFELRRGKVVGARVHGHSLCLCVWVSVRARESVCVREDDQAWAHWHDPSRVDSIRLLQGSPVLAIPRTIALLRKHFRCSCKNKF